MKLTNTRIILFLLTFLISVILVYLINGIVVPVWEDGFNEQYNERCWH